MLAIAFGLCSCGMERGGVERGSACPEAIKAEDSSDNSIQSGHTKLSALIYSIAAICVPVKHGKMEAKGVKTEAYTDYELAVTVVVNYEIKNPKEYGASGQRFRDRIRLEALSKEGVVLGNGFADFSLIPGGSSTRVSGKISGLSDEEARRVAKVTARWTYGER